MVNKVIGRFMYSLKHTGLIGHKEKQVCPLPSLAFISLVNFYFLFLKPLNLNIL